MWEKFKNLFNNSENPSKDSTKLFFGNKKNYSQTSTKINEDESSDAINKGSSKKIRPLTILLAAVAIVLLFLIDVEDKKLESNKAKKIDETKKNSGVSDSQDSDKKMDLENRFNPIKNGDNQDNVVSSDIENVKGSKNPEVGVGQNEIDSQKQIDIEADPEDPFMKSEDDLTQESEMENEDMVKEDPSLEASQEAKEEGANESQSEENDLDINNHTDKEQGGNDQDQSVTNISENQDSSKEIVSRVMPEEYKIDFTQFGRGLVYNCSKGHWSCVDRENYFKCLRGQKWSLENGRKIECVKFDVYATIRDCEIVQSFNIDSLKLVNECKNE